MKREWVFLLLGFSLFFNLAYFASWHKVGQFVAAQSVENIDFAVNKEGSTGKSQAAADIMDRPGFSNKNNAVVADARSVFDGDDADGGAAAAGNVDIERAPRQPSPPLQPRRPPLEPPPLEPPRRESSSLRGPPSWSEEPPAAPPPRSPAQPREPPAQAGEPLPQRGEELQDAFLPQDGAPQRLQPGAAVLSAPLSYSGPLLTPPTQDIRSMAEESIVWSRLGPCRFGRSLLAPWLPDSACRWDDCLQCRGGYCLLESLLLESPMPVAGDHKCPEPSGGQVFRNGSQPLVSFVWTVHNNAEMAAKALLCVFRTAHEVPSAEFVLYDDGSTEDMSTLVSLIQTLQWEFGTNIVILSSPQGKAQGYTLANTVALRQARGKYAVLLNTDLCPLPGWLGVLVRTIQTYPGAGIVGPMMVNPQGRVMEVGGSVFQEGRPANRERGSAPSELMFLHATSAGYISAACVLFDRELFLSQGLFDPQFAPAYFEDTDAALTMRAAGYLTVVQPLAVVVHAEGSTYSSKEKEERMRVNQQRFYTKHKAQLDQHCPVPMDSCRERASVDRAITYDAFQRQGAQVLIMDFSVPEPDRDSGSLRMFEILQIVIDLGYGVSFQPESEKSLARYVAPLLAMGVNVMQPGSLKAMAASVKTRGATKPTWACPWSVVMISRRSTYRMQEAHVRAICPSVPVVFDTVDLHYIRERRSVEVALAKGDTTKVFVMDAFWDPVATSKAKLESLLKEGEDLEVGYMASSDFVLVVSTDEYTIASEMVGADKVRILTNIYPEPDRERGATLEGRQGGLFVGSMCHTPNLDASKFIMREIFGPTTRGVFPPGFMHFVWSGTEKCKALVGELIEEAEEHPLITLHLDVTDQELAALHMKVQFFLGALRVGAGVKGKLCQALLYGLPIIGSKAATEGMHLKDDVSVLAASTVAEYRAQIERLAGSPDLWHQLRKNGFDLIQKHFGRGNARGVLQDIFTKLKVAPRVTLQAPRLATSTWACPLQDPTRAVSARRQSEDEGGSKRRLEAPGGRPRRNRKTAAPSSEKNTCPYTEDSPYPAIVPTLLLKDRLLGDDVSQDGESAVRKVSNSASGHCPDSTTPTPEHPFIFYHAEHCSGEVLTHILVDGLKALPATNTTVGSAITAIPGQGALPATCSLAWNVDKARADSCNVDPGFPKASLYFGTFSPLRLGRVNHGTCFVMLRNPVSRAMAHFDAQFGLTERFDYKALDYKAFTNMSNASLEDAVQATGTGLYLSRYLGCKGQDCEGKNARGVLDAARQQLQRCHVGIAEMPRETMSYLLMLLPWARDASTAFTILDDGAAEASGRLKAGAFTKDTRSKLAVLFQGDNFIYEDGTQAFDKQMRGAWSCYSSEKFTGDEPTLVREVRRIARRVTRRKMEDRIQMSTCLERRKLCSGHAVDARDCRCSELMEFRDD